MTCVKTICVSDGQWHIITDITVQKKTTIKTLNFKKLNN